MVRVAFFVDGPHLLGSLHAMGLEVHDYQSFYDHLFRASVQMWRARVGADESIAVLLQRVHWYAIGSMDALDFENAQTRQRLKDQFDADAQLTARYLEQASKLGSQAAPDPPGARAWSSCLQESRSWYEDQRRALERMKRFYYDVQCSTDLIDIIEAGHWQIDVLARSCQHRRLETRLAVDLIALESCYDVALVVAGDDDAIPAMEIMKRRGKQVGAVELVKGYPQEPKWRGLSSRIQLVADFVVRLYEMDLLSSHVGRRSTPDATGTAVS